jgi:hypothetical protein
MVVATIRIDGAYYSFGGEWAAVRAAIVAASRSGGAFVSLLTRAGPADVFISESSKIVVEHQAMDYTNEAGHDGHEEVEFNPDEL